MDPNMMIRKTLTENDVCYKNRLFLPKDKVENITRSTGVPIPRNGIQVEIKDNDNSYWVNLGVATLSSYIGYEPP
ncbi:B3 domain-containing protein At1g08985-like [Arabidopsis lyrata subsp. lyrata]|uniref:B3 domain-containing protein At1g08985-like n=1 Tax=Arabidopsis lyrata subsp. lyrata TaxID=81972 RepID=UPI000A29C68F|nr:B3 domain-containing protein At1g08985-like [Arabidopsis lyrata subsp. lyrata]|eukprot:XP_020880708.1 B3 domain-containing protein At1g08985-like [Arabidopsis lyrata subsp. lyrata]